MDEIQVIINSKLFYPYEEQRKEFHTGGGGGEEKWAYYVSTDPSSLQSIAKKGFNKNYSNNHKNTIELYTHLDGNRLNEDEDEDEDEGYPSDEDGYYNSDNSNSNSDRDSDDDDSDNDSDRNSNSNRNTKKIWVLISSVLIDENNTSSAKYSKQKRSILVSDPAVILPRYLLLCSAKREREREQES